MYAQDGATVSWEPRIALPPLDWQTVLTGLAFGLALFGLYRFLAWVTARRRDVGGWKATRWMCPLAMLGVQWATYFVTTRGSGTFSWVVAVLLSVLGCLFWHFVIRLLEWRAEIAGIVILHISEPMRR